MKEIQLKIDIRTLTIHRDNYRQSFKRKFDWRSKYYFEIFVGSYRYTSSIFTLHQTNDDERLVYNPNVSLKAVLYLGKYIDIWLREYGRDEVIVTTCNTYRHMVNY